MKAQLDIQAYLEQGRQHLAQGQAREAAIAYAHGAQLEPNDPQVHLGLAEANLALGNYPVVQMACQRVQELQPGGGDESLLARALLNLLGRYYEYALQDVDTLISHDPSIAYVHALRSYLLRALGQTYDANLARTRSVRLSFGGRFDNCFPPLPEGYATQSGQSAEAATGRAGSKADSMPTWSNRSKLQRQIVRTRFALGQYPRLVTISIIAINVVVYLVSIGGLVGGMSQDEVLLAGGQIGSLSSLIATGEYWRIFTAMFLHFSLIHIGLNMLSLFFIGPVVETVYGKWRYLVIYLGAGIFGGIVTSFADPQALSAGASGAIFGVFGALGVFYLVNQRSLGSYGRGAIGNWLFWLALNLVWGISVPGIGIADHIGGLVAGMLLAFLLIPRTNRRRI